MEAAAALAAVMDVVVVGGAAVGAARNRNPVSSTGGIFLLETGFLRLMSMHFSAVALVTPSGLLGVRNWSNE